MPLILTFVKNCSLLFRPSINYQKLLFNKNIFSKVSSYLMSSLYTYGHELKKICPRQGSPCNIFVGVRLHYTHVESRIIMKDEQAPTRTIHLGNETAAAFNWSSITSFDHPGLGTTLQTSQRANSTSLPELLAMAFMIPQEVGLLASA